MMKIIEWAFSPEAPVLANIAAILFAAASIIFCFVMFGFLIAYGYWIVALGLFVLIPFWIIVNQYAKRP